MNSFSALPLLPSLHATLKDEGFVTPTEIQQKSLPALLAKKSLVGVSETGSGKTLAYTLPILHDLKTQENEGSPVKKEGMPRALVLVPTRDLGEQVAKVFKPFTHTTRLRVRTVLGGTAFDVARRNVNGLFEVLVATPGRLVQLIDRKLIDLSDVKILVFDEADQMLDKSFLSDATKIANCCSALCQRALFSATVSPAVETLMTDLFSGAEVIRTSGSHRVVASLTTKNITVVDGKRFPLLEKILLQPTEGGTLIFTNTREQCDRLADLLKQKNIKALIYRGEMDKNQRRQNLKSFRKGEGDILISTDLASRGLDVKHISRVINYHLPKEMENYIHRVGRTARAGREGLVINLVTERDGTLISRLGGIKPATKT
jgi:ATP-dependent RNA helicase RhlE